MMISGDDPKGQPEEGGLSLSDVGSLFEEEGSLDEAAGEEADESEVEDDDAPESDAEPKEEESFTIKHDGKEVTLKKSEYDEMAQKGFDYTAKTMAVAEERKQAEQHRAQAEQLRQQNEKALQHSVEQLKAYETFIQSQIGTPPPIEWAQQDAAYYLAQKELFESRKGQLQEAQKAIHQLTEEGNRQRQARLVQTAAESERALRSTIKGFDDQMIQDLAKYIGEHGLNSENTAEAFVQKGMWEMAHKAKAYDALMAQKAQIKPTKELPKVHKPSASNPVSPSVTDKRNRLEAHARRPSLESVGNLM